MAFTQDQMDALLRQAAMNAHTDQNFGFERVRRADRSDTFHYTQAPPPPRKPSKFDGPNVIDLVRGVDGVWRVPAALEPQVRTL